MAESGQADLASTAKVLITGANGHLGRRLIAQLAGSNPVVAVVRSEQAAQKLSGLATKARLEIHVLDYTDSQALRRVAADCEYVVHLVGIIKESASSRYVEAHEDTCRALVEALSSSAIKKLVYLSILGAEAGSSNACLSSKGRAERILLESALPVASLRVPMVLGEGDFAASALKARAYRSVNLVLRADSMEQPIYAGDVINAILAAMETSPAREGGIDLAGAESLNRKQLIQRAASLLNRETRVISLPLWIGLLAAAILQGLLANPPVTTAMLGVLDHDDQVDTESSRKALGIQLTSLDETLRRILL